MGLAAPPVPALPRARNSVTCVDTSLLEEAVELARMAGELTLRYFRSAELGVDRKGDGTPVTAADRGAERLLREELAKRHPDDGIYGEEEAETLGTSGRRWIIDPIDGTKAFTQGVPLYTNLLAVEDPEGIAVGVINVPALGEAVWAGRGMGCFCNDAPARVSTRGDLAGAYVSTSSFAPWSDAALAAARAASLNLRTWGDGYGYVLVATGRVEAMVDPVAELYDLAPMPVILDEAGGRFTSLDGRADPGLGSGVASNGLVHDELLELLGGDAARVDTVLG
jgi:histidinol phosphatase-like enzyme (inositol monophosphatase family)